MSTSDSATIVQVSVEEMKQNLLTYLQRVQAGETLVVVSANKPLAEIRPIAPSRLLRPFGLCSGEFSVPDDFDAPLPEHIIQEFEGK